MDSSSLRSSTQDSQFVSGVSKLSKRRRELTVRESRDAAPVSFLHFGLL